jgi:hypothetical protein
VASVPAVAGLTVALQLNDPPAHRCRWRVILLTCRVTPHTWQLYENRDSPGQLLNDHEAGRCEGRRLVCHPPQDGRDE